MVIGTGTDRGLFVAALGPAGYLVFAVNRCRWHGTGQARGLRRRALSADGCRGESEDRVVWRSEVFSRPYGYLVFLSEEDYLSFCGDLQQ